MGGGEDLDLGGEEDLDLGGEEEPDLGDEEAGGEDDVLLATPGNRDDSLDLGIRNLKNRKNPNVGYTTKGSNGKVYHPVQSDKRDIGAAHRRTKGSWSDETARATVRNVWKAPSIIGLEEDKESNYDDEEILLQETKQDVRNLIMELEKTDNGEKA